MDNRGRKQKSQRYKDSTKINGGLAAAVVPFNVFISETRFAHRLDVAVVGSAASAEHDQLRQQPLQLAILRAQFLWIAIIQIQRRPLVGKRQGNTGQLIVVPGFAMSIVRMRP